MKYLLSLLIIATACSGPVTKTNVSVLVVAGGHSYDTLAFHAVFQDMEGIVFETALQPEANRIIASETSNNYDAIVFYDSWQTISEEEKLAYMKLLENGTGMVFMHHALVSYQSWPEFTNIIGGKYLHPNHTDDTLLVSDYMHDIWLRVNCNQDHPVTQGIEAFDIYDEGYMNLYVSPDVTTLMTTTHEFCDEIIGWAHQVNNSRVVYLLPGHAAEGLHHPDFQKIIENAIRWVTKAE